MPTQRHELTRPAIAGYEIEAEIGRGASGVVYRARQLNLGRTVALKVLLAAHHAGAEQLKRFQDEARTLATLQHPGIVLIHDVGVAGGLPYISMEYLPGGNLTGRIAREPPGIRDTAALMAELADAVHAAHQQGVIHRDLKPANVLLSAAGHPKITDFGIAKRLAVAESVTRTGEVIGTPGYMSPEQAGGVTREITPRTDIYSLGSILYELLTGRPPFRGFDPVETLMAVLTEEPVTVRHLAPGVPRDLETICHKCLQKSPSKRYSSAKELAKDLHRFLDGRPIVARRITAAGRVWRWARRRPAWASLVAAVTVFVVVFTGFAAWKNRQLATSLGETQNALDRSSENFRKAIAAVSRRFQRHGDPGIDPLREELQFLQTIRYQDGNTPRERWEQALAASWSGLIFAQLNDTAMADAAFREAIAVLHELAGQIPDKRRELARDLSQAESRLATFLTAGAQLDEAQSLYRQAINRLEKELVLSANDPDLLRSIGIEYNNLAILLARRGAPADDAYERSRVIRQELVDRYPDQPSYQYDLAVSQINLAAHAMRRDDYESAESLLTAALTGLLNFVEHQGADEEARRALTSCQLNLALALSRQSRDAESRAAFQEAIGRLRQWVGHTPQSVPLRLLLIDGLQNWFNQQIESDELAAAQKSLQEMLDVYQSLVDDFPENEAYRAGLEKTNGRLQLILGEF